MPQVSVTPENTSPAPTKADRPTNAGSTTQPSIAPTSTSRPAAMRTWRSSDIAFLPRTTGSLACVEAGLPVVRGRKAVSLERQVRIAAGLLVLLGAILGWVVDPAFVGLSAFVGAGLVFAGITDTCGMGIVLARMPWNQCRDEKPSDCAR